MFPSTGINIRYVYPLTYLVEFCDALDLGMIELPDWYAKFLHPLPDRRPPESPFSTLDKRLEKKAKHGRGEGRKAAPQKDKRRP